MIYLFFTSIQHFTDVADVQSLPSSPQNNAILEVSCTKHRCV